MKIIVAGMPKTGTKSMHAALTMLGFTVYDFLEHACYHHNEWKKILESGADPQLFRKMYRDVDAVVDMPANFFWEQIHEAFPDSKIILLTRDEDAWYRSYCHQARENNEWSMFKLAMFVTPTGIMYRTHIKKASTVVFGMARSKPWMSFRPNETIARLKYRHHNCYVLHNAPKDKLLVVNIQQGWGPLCKFLDVEVPNIPFPHKNKEGSALKEAAASNPIMRKIYRELFVLFVILCLVVVVFAILMFCR